MALDLSAGSLVRAGSGLLFVALGAFVLATGRRHAAARGFAAYAVAWGVSVALVNLTRPDPALGPPAIWTATALAVLAAVGIVRAATFGLPAREVLVASLPVAGLTVVAVLFYARSVTTETILATGTSVQGAFADWIYIFVLVAVVFPTVCLAGVLFARRHSSEADAVARRGLALATVALLAWFMVQVGVSLHDLAAQVADSGFRAFTLAQAPVAAPVVAWLAATRGLGGREARDVALALPAFAILGMLLPDTVTIGVVRSLGVLALFVCVSRYRWLGFTPALPTVRRGTAAAVTLVGFFVVTQVAQQFLSESMGVILGGVAAGVLLFAAAPLQRAVEGLASRQVAVVDPGRHADDAATEAYRDALRLALHDGAMTLEEERHLASLADRLGVTYGQAVRLRGEVEAELTG